MAKYIKHELNAVTLDFLRHWLAWANSYSHPHSPDGGSGYNARHGLCAAARRYENMHDIPHSICDTLDDAFMHEFGTDAYPFGGMDVYEGMFESMTQHLYEPRLEWVRRQISASCGE